jgi:hypothetical protein
VTTASITYSEFPSIADRCDVLGVRRPVGITMLPRNLTTATTGDELLAEAADAAVRTLWRQAEIEEDRLDSPELPFPRLSEHHADWIGPTVFLSSALLSETPALVNIALGVVANYVTDLFRGIPGKHTARLHVVVEQSDGKCVQLTYNGPATGIGEILDAVGDLTGSDGQHQ